MTDISSQLPLCASTSLDQSSMSLLINLPVYFLKRLQYPQNDRLASSLFNITNCVQNRHIKSRDD